MTIAQVLMKVKINRVFLFNGVEQGVGKYSRRVYVYYKLGMRNEVHRWICQYYGKDF